MIQLISINNFEDTENVQSINSPRTLEACLRTGIDPSELIHHDRDYFKARGQTRSMTDYKYQKVESKRNEKIELIMNERELICKYAEKQLLQSPGGHDPATNDLTAGDGVDMEKRRIEALLKRQEKELQNTIQREQQAANLQKSIDEATKVGFKREKEHAKAVLQQKKEAEKKQKKIEEDKKLAELEEEHQRKDMMRKEREVSEVLAKKKLQMERQIAADARMRDKKRQEKAMEYKEKTEALIKVQDDAIAKKRTLMLEKSQRIHNQMVEKKEQKLIEATIAREKAQARIQAAVAKQTEMNERQLKNYETKQQNAIALAKENMKLAKERLLEQAKKRERAATDRHNRLVNAFMIRREHIKDVVKRREMKDGGFEQTQKDRLNEIKLNKFKRDLQMAEKAENIEREARRREFKRLQYLEAIKAADDTFEKIARAKVESWKTQQNSAKSSMLRKYEIAEAMATMKQTNNYSLLDKILKPQDEASDDPGNDEKVKPDAQ